MKYYVLTSSDLVDIFKGPYLLRSYNEGKHFVTFSDGYTVEEKDFASNWFCLLKIDIDRLLDNGQRIYSTHLIYQDLLEN